MEGQATTPRRQPPPPPPPPPHPDVRAGVVREMFARHAAGGAGGLFTVRPPRRVLDDPAMVYAADAAARCGGPGSRWWVKYRDGREYDLTLAELLVLALNLAAFGAQVRERMRREGPRLPPGVRVRMTFDLDTDPRPLLAPGAAARVLSWLTIEGVPRPAREGEGAS